MCLASCSAHSSIKIMEGCQKTSDSRQVDVGAKEQSSTMAICPNQQEVKAPTSTANTSKPAQLNCTLKQRKGSVAGGTNRGGDQHDGENNFQDLKSKKTHLQRLPNPLTYYGLCNKREMKNGEKDNIHVKSDPKRKRTKESANTAATHGGYTCLEKTPNMCEIHPINPL